MATTYEPGYPVNFYAGGDTTREAFSKHIQEILKIYGILNALQSTKADSTAVTKAIEDAKTLLTDKIATTKTELTTALTNHINSTDPHPNLQLTTLKGNLPASRLSGTLSETQLPYISSSKITGNFDAYRISGLEDYIKSYVKSSITANVGNVETLDSGSNAWATVDYSNGKLTFKFGIPKGPQGPRGADGANGKSYSESTSHGGRDGE